MDGSQNSYLCSRAQEQRISQQQKEQQSKYPTDDSRTHDSSIKLSRK